MDENERKGIVELTDLLRHDDEWKDLREDLTKEGFDLSGVLLAFFLESEECEEHGAIVTSDRRVLRFIREPVPELTSKKRFVLFKDITHDSKAIDESREQIETALEMIGGGSGATLS